MINPEAAAARGALGDKNFLDRVAELNPALKHTQFADYHGHGLVFRAVFKHDRKGNLLDLDDNKIDHRDPRKFAKSCALERRAPRERDAVRRLATSLSMFTATECSTRAAQRHSDHMRRLFTELSTNGRR